MMVRLLSLVESRVTWNGHAVFKVGELADILGTYDSDGVARPYTKVSKVLAEAVEAGVLIDSRAGSRGPIRCIQLASGLSSALGNEYSPCSWCSATREVSKFSRHRARKAIRDEVESGPEFCGLPSLQERFLERQIQKDDALTSASTATSGPSGSSVTPETVPELQNTGPARSSGCSEADDPGATSRSVGAPSSRRLVLVQDEEPATSGPPEASSSGGFEFGVKAAEPEPAYRFDPDEPIDPDRYLASVDWVRQQCEAEGISW